MTGGRPRPYDGEEHEEPAAHECTETCVCPMCNGPLLFHQKKGHACQDKECVYAHGLRSPRWTFPTSGRRNGMMTLDKAAAALREELLSRDVYWDIAEEIISIRRGAGTLLPGSGLGLGGGMTSRGFRWTYDHDSGSWQKERRPEQPEAL